MAAYAPTTQREFALIHIGFVPDLPQIFEHAPPSTSPPTPPVYPDTLNSYEKAQVDLWLKSKRLATDDSAVTLASAITKRDAFKIYFALLNAWQVADYAGKWADWHGMYVDALMQRHNAATVPPSQTSDAAPVNPPASPTPRNPT